MIYIITTALAAILLNTNLNSQGKNVLNIDYFKEKTTNKENKLTNKECGTIYFNDKNKTSKIENNLFKTAVFSTKKGIKKSITLNNPGMSFIGDNFTHQISPSCDLAWLELLDKGDVHDDAGNVVEIHERYYCVFVALPKACLVAIHTDMTCVGKFDAMNRWIRDDVSPPLNFFAHDLPTAQKFANNANERDDLVMELNNILRCDPISQKNTNDYLKIVKDSGVDMSPELKSLIIDKLKN